MPPNSHKKPESFVATIDGRSARTSDIFWTEFAKRLNFPSCCNVKNKDSFHDCVTDMGWVKEVKMLVILTNYDKLLRGDPIEKGSVIYKFSQFAKDLGQAHPHLDAFRFPPKAFHTLLHAPKDYRFSAIDTVDC